MKKFNLLKLIIIIIFIIILCIFVTLKLILNKASYNNDTSNYTPYDNITTDTALSTDLSNISNITFQDYNEKVKGIIFSSYKGTNTECNYNILNIKNNYMIYNDHIGCDIPDYNSFTLYTPLDIEVLSYTNSRTISFDDIEENDILIYNGTISYSTSSSSPNIAKINGDSPIYILKENELSELVLNEYNDKKELSNVHIRYQTPYLEDFNVTYLFAEITYISSKNDKFIYPIILEISEDTIVKNNNVKTELYEVYANIVLKNSFEISEASAIYSVKNIKEITYKN